MERNGKNDGRKYPKQFNRPFFAERGSKDSLEAMGVGKLLRLSVKSNAVAAQSRGKEDR